jgi:predicted acetyltransferase
MNLVLFSDITESQYEDYIQEWESSGESIAPSATRRRDYSFQELQEVWATDQTDIMYERNFVPSTLYFYLDDDSRIIGAIHLRHVLNNRLLQNGGHIGYGIRPSERGHGYASQMLSDLLYRIGKEGYEKVLITCDDTNLASVKTIEKNGGILLDKPVFEGVLTRRYWITI